MHQRHKYSFKFTRALMYIDVLIYSKIYASILMLIYIYIYLQKPADVPYFSDYKAHIKSLYLLKNRRCALYSSVPYVWTVYCDCPILFWPCSPSPQFKRGACRWYKFILFACCVSDSTGLSKHDHCRFLRNFDNYR